MSFLFGVQVAPVIQEEGRVIFQCPLHCGTGDHQSGGAGRAHVAQILLGGRRDGGIRCPTRKAFRLGGTGDPGGFGGSSHTFL